MGKPFGKTAMLDWIARQVAFEGAVLWSYDAKMQRAADVVMPNSELMELAGRAIEARADTSAGYLSLLPKVMVLLKEEAESIEFFKKFADLARARRIYLGLATDHDVHSREDAFYIEAVTAPSAWLRTVHTPQVPVSEVQEELVRLAVLGHPTSAFLYTVGNLVTEILFFRHPNAKRGIPSPPQCDEAIRMLCDKTGWVSRRDHTPDSGLVVALGLREGFFPNAPVHSAELIAARIGGNLKYRKARIVSARASGIRSHWNDEPGMSIMCAKEDLPRLSMVAEQIGQEQYVTTDLDEPRTSAWKSASAPEGV
jgi:hypothetical protein